jgi:hypothetical protein
VGIVTVFLRRSVYYLPQSMGVCVELVVGDQSMARICRRAEYSKTGCVVDRLTTLGMNASVWYALVYNTCSLACMSTPQGHSTRQNHTCEYWVVYTLSTNSRLVELKQLLNHALTHTVNTSGYSMFSHQLLVKCAKLLVFNCENVSAFRELDKGQLVIF